MQLLELELAAAAAVLASCVTVAPVGAPRAQAKPPAACGHLELRELTLRHVDEWSAPAPARALPALAPTPSAHLQRCTHRASTRAFSPRTALAFSHLDRRCSQVESRVRTTCACCTALRWRPLTLTVCHPLNTLPSLSPRRRSESPASLARACAARARLCSSSSHSLFTSVPSP